MADAIHNMTDVARSEAVDIMGPLDSSFKTAESCHKDEGETQLTEDVVNLYQRRLGNNA